MYRMECSDGEQRLRFDAKKKHSGTIFLPMVFFSSFQSIVFHKGSGKLIISRSLLIMFLP